MHEVRFLSRIRRGALPVLALVALQACGGSSTSVSSVTSPSSVNRCAITMQPIDGPLPATGGSGAIPVTAARECAWSASVEGAWLSLKSGASGQGDGTVEFAATANPDPVTRRGAVVANGQRTEISQAAGECELSLSQSFASFNQSGGSGQVQVRASSGMCSWSAAADAEWVQIRTASGQGNGVVSFEIPASTGPPRSATINVAGQKFSIVQSEGCTYAINPNSFAAAPSGGSTRVAINTTASCPWTAVSNSPWLSLSPASGNGPASVTVNVSGTTGPPRTGTAVVAGQTFTVSQTQGCTFAISPESASVSSTASTGRVTVTAGPGCNWSASSNASWLTITSGSSGSGSGDVQYSAAAVSGPARSGTLTIAGRTFTLNQGDGCSFSLSSTTANIDDSGGQGQFNVQTGSGCGWTASSAVPWLTISAGSSGNGNGTVRFTAAANTGPPRNGTISAGGQTFTVQQGNGCSYSLSSGSINFPASGGSGTVNVSTAAGCGWTATSNGAWLTVTSGASGTGNGTVGFTALSTSGPQRSGVITIGGETFRVIQAEGCAYTITPEQVSIGATAGTTNVAVATNNSCTWNTQVNAPWLSIATGASGTGNGTVQVGFEANSAGPRSGTVTIAGKTFTVNQGTGCSFTINPTAQTVPATGGSVPVTVNAAASCAWTAASNAPWLTITSGASGNGAGTTQVDVQPNSGAPRSGTATIAGQTLTISQDSGCTFVVTPEVIGAAAGGANTHIDIAAAASCPWTATSNAPFIAIVSANAGSGNGGIDISTGGNTGPARSGTLTVAGRTVTVNQDSGCVITLGAMSTTIGAGGGGSSVSVSASAGTCPWTAVSNVPWITVTGGSPGAGAGTVTFNVDANTTGAARAGTITIGGVGFTVNQQ